MWPKIPGGAPARNQGSEEDAPTSQTDTDTDTETNTKTLEDTGA